MLIEFLRSEAPDIAAALALVLFISFILTVFA